MSAAKKKKKTSSDAPLAERVEGYFSLKRILVDPSTPPKVAHQIFWTRIGTEYTLDVGHYDPASAREAIKSAVGKPPEEAPTVDLFITHRFTLGHDAMVRFAQGIEALKDDLEKAEAALGKVKVRQVQTTSRSGNGQSKKS